MVLKRDNNATKAAAKKRLNRAIKMDTIILRINSPPTNCRQRQQQQQQRGRATNGNKYQIVIRAVAIALCSHLLSF